MEYSTRIVDIYLKYVSMDDIHVYSMGFRHVIAQDLKEMDTRLFFDAPMGIRFEIAARG